MSKNTWQIINKESNVKYKSNWIEEEEYLLNWAENPNFEKQPLDNIAITFIYTDDELAILGGIRTSIELEKRERSSILYRSEFFDKIHLAKNPKTLFTNDEIMLDKWLEKSYIFNDAVLFTIPTDYEQTQVESKMTFTSLQFSKDVLKIPSSLILFHSLYEIVVILREAKNISGLKSILKSEFKMGKTKKVRISNESPKEFVFSNINPVSRKRRTKKTYH